MSTKIGIIGYGNMGSCLAQQLKRTHKIYIFDKDISKTQAASGIEVLTAISDLIKTTSIIIIAVKPQDFPALLTELKGKLNGKLIITIAAGITTGYIEGQLPGVKVVRVMPNLALRVNKGMVCLCRAKTASIEDLNFAISLFNNFGKTLILEEKMMNAATAVSGSGPGYLYDWAENKSIAELKEYAKKSFIPALAQAAYNLGFSKEQADILAKVTAEGSIAFLEETGLSAPQAKSQVASRGGTTEAGLEVLHKGGSLGEAVKAALKRAEELSR